MLAYSFYESDTRILQYTKALTARGDSVDVISLRRPGAAPVEVVKGVRVFRLQERAVNESSRLSYLLRILRFTMLAAFFLAKRNSSSRYDVVHVHSVPDFLVFAAIVPKFLGTKIFLDIHDILPEFYASKFQLAQDSFSFKLLLLCERLSAAFADHVIIANEIWRARLLSRSIRSRKCTTILNYPDPEIFYPRPMLSRKNAFVILYPGTLNRHQGVDIALRAFSRVADLLPNAEFHIYGEGPEKPSLLALRESLGLTSRVQINGFLPLSEIAIQMAAADLAVVPKRTTSSFGNEAASGKIMEFMSVGVPVIVSRTRIDTSYFNDSMVRFVEPENERELGDAILELARCPKLRQDMVMHATRYIEQNNWQQRKVDYLNLVDCSPTAVPKVSESSVHA